MLLKSLHVLWCLYYLVLVCVYFTLLQEMFLKSVCQQISWMFFNFTFDFLYDPDWDISWDEDFIIASISWCVSFLLTWTLTSFQIWASSFLPNEPAVKDRTQREYYEKNNSPLLIDYVKLEMEKKVLSSTTDVKTEIASGESSAHII